MAEAGVVGRAPFLLYFDRDAVEQVDELRCPLRRRCDRAGDREARLRHAPDLGLGIAGEGHRRANRRRQRAGGAQGGEDRGDTSTSDATDDGGAARGPSAGTLGGGTDNGGIAYSEGEEVGGWDTESEGEP